MPNSWRTNGAALERADKRNKEIDYPDIENDSSAQLLCLGVETYGRWNHHCITLMRQLASYKANNAPDYLKNSVKAIYFARWWNLLSVQVQVIVGESILRLSGSDLIEGAESSQMPALSELM